jgi:hypothetical protein
MVTFPRFRPRYEATTWPLLKIWFPAIFAVMGTVPVMETTGPDTVLFMTTGDVETAVPVYARPRVGDVLDETVNVPNAAITGLSVTVSPIINPFVLAT